MKMRMNTTFRPRAFLPVILIFVSMGLMAQNVSDTRFRKKSFPINQDATLEVENKYGTILIVPWDKDSVQISAEIYLEAKNSSRLRKLKNDIEISFSASPDFVLARTVLGDGGSRIASEIRTLSNNLGARSAVEVNYTIYMPEHINLILTNKFGDIYIDDIRGDIDISLSNGSLKANHFFGNSHIELTFAKGTVRHLGTTTLRLSYAELKVVSAEQVDLISKSSHLEIESSGVLKLDSRRDKITLGKVEYLFGNGNFSELYIKDFLWEADCKLKYGELSMDRIMAGFSRINIESDFTDLNLNFEPACSYSVDIIHNEKAVINFPHEKSLLESSRIGEEMLSLEGRVGDQDTQSILSIRANQKCYIKLSRH